MADLTKQPRVGRGLLFALAAIPLGIVIWVVIWELGYVASLASFVIAGAALWLYEKGAGAEPSRKAGVGLVGIFIGGVVLAFLAGMVVDGWMYYNGKDGQQLGSSVELSTGQKLQYIVEDMQQPKLWEGYSNDILLTLLFTAIGGGYIVLTLFKNPKSANQDKAATNPTKSS